MVTPDSQTAVAEAGACSTRPSAWLAKRPSVRRRGRGRRRARASRRTRCGGSRRRPARSRLVVHHERPVLGHGLADRADPAAPGPRRRRPRPSSATGTSGAHGGAGAMRRARGRRLESRLALEHVERADGLGPGAGGSVPARRPASRRRCQMATSVSGRAGPRAAAAAAAAARPPSAPGDDRDLDVTAVVVGGLDPGDVVVPQHREVRVDQLVLGRAGSARSGRARVGLSAVLVEQREHLGVDDAAAGGQPLRRHPGRSGRWRRASRSGRCSPGGRRSPSRSPGAGAGGSRGRPGRGTCSSRRVPEKSMPRSRPSSEAGGAKRSSPAGIGVEVVDAEEERVDGRPRRGAELHGLDDGIAHEGVNRPATPEIPARGPTTRRA